MQVAHQVMFANMLNPAPAATKVMASALFAVLHPTHTSNAEHAIPSHTAVCRPRRLPNLRTAISVNQPPTGLNSNMARYGVAPHNPPRLIVKPRARNKYMKNQVSKKYMA